MLWSMSNIIVLVFIATMQTLMSAEVILCGEMICKMTFSMTAFFCPAQSSALSQIDMVC